MHVSDSSTQNAPTGATYILLVIDPDNLITEANESNNSQALGLCPISLLIEPKFPSQGYVDNCLDPAFKAQLACFESKVGSKNITKDSGCRSQKYQNHLREIWSNANKLRQLSCIRVVGDGKSALQFATTPECAGCQAIVAELNDELLDHFPGTFPPEVAIISRHTDGNAVDWSISGIEEAKITALADSCNLKRPLWPDQEGRFIERWHFTLKDTQPRYSIVVQGHSPVNILVRDPSGRGIGFDPATTSAINEIGRPATYSGPGTMPQIIQIEPDGVLFGKYLVSGVGTGAGAYTVDLIVNSDDNEIHPVQTVLASGNARAGQPLTPISGTDFIGTTLRLRYGVESGNIILRGPPWATNSYIEYTSSLPAGLWKGLPGVFDPINGLLVTNPIAGTKFFRLKLP